MDVAVGIYKDRVLAWRVGTSPPEVVFSEDLAVSAFAIQDLLPRGFHVVIVFRELEDGGVAVAL